MIKTRITGKHVRESLDFTRRVIDAFGPRLCGTEACEKSARVIHAELKRRCVSSGIEEFDLRPNAFLGFVRVSTVVYIISSLFLFFEYLVPAVLGYTFTIVMILSQFVLYLQVFDFLYKKKKGCNVYGVIEPRGEVKQQIILGSHHDSARVFNYFTYFPRLYRIRLILGFGPIVLSFFILWAWIIMAAATGHKPFFADWLRYGAVASFVFTGQLFFFIGKNGTPGAGDNLISTAISITLAGIFGVAKNNKKPLLEHTRLVILSFDAEESGLRGARAYVKKHREELLSVPTRVFNMDSIYDADKIKLLISDINGLRMLSRKMAGECVDVATRLGYRPKFFRFLFGAGGTDAAEFAKIGVEATTLIAMPISVERDAVVYHTPADTVENIEPGAVEAVLKIAAAYIAEKDAQCAERIKPAGKTKRKI